MPDPKKKGYAFEREIVNHVIERGFDAQRAWGSDGRSLGFGHNVDILIDGRTFQLKRRASIADYVTPDNDVFGQIIRADRKPAYVVLRLDDFLDLIGGVK